ncbi:MAG: YciI family protein [Pseudonocardiaceae bacterium]|nr:YciI family protein [Pseudonocardiaceae bacterium]
MQYLLLICGDENIAPDRAHERDDARMVDWLSEMDARGVRVRSARLRTTNTATTVRTRDGEVLLSDGPFAETKEQILGFELLECADLDEALEIAAKHPSAEYGPIEVRPVWE